MPHAATANLLTLHGLIALVAILFYVVTSHVARQRRQPAAAIAWVLFMLLLPYLALPAFLTFGLRKLRYPHADAPKHRPSHDGSHPWAIETTMALGQPAPAIYQDLNLHKDGSEARAALLDIIDGAQASIDLSTFILGNDTLGDTVVEHLCRQARRGVRVRLLLDGMGSLMAGHPNFRAFTQAGGKVAIFVPFLRSFLKGGANLRDHRKLIVADAGLEAARLWCGGRNLAEEYFDGKSDLPPWRDLSFDVRGPLVAQASALFDGDWRYANGEPRRPQPLLPDGLSLPQYGAQLIASGPDQDDDTLYALLVTAAYRAQRRVVLVTPYFVPDPALLTALCLAARRGVAVELLLPARSNHRLSDFARERALRAMVDAGAKVWLAPAMLHAKCVIVDDVLALAGSANLDGRSLFLNFEMMVAFHKGTDVGRFANWCEQERRTTRPYVASRPGLIRDVAEGTLLWIAFQL